ncbi:MAG: ATP-binding protein [Kiritimatiellae bacterium]|jgi:predicted AAA+ superfamily ATPase|nr:ATP-binding protein [Kiritimatiellia bacterium]
MKLRRNLELKLAEYLESFPIVAILGVRQCGKTTLSQMVRSNWNYFDLERAEDYELITRDFGFFLREYPDATIIDEAQVAPDLFKELRGVIDKNRNQKGRYIITGSSSPTLKSVLSESLAGRVGLIEMGTLKMNERYNLPLSPFYSILNDLPLKDQLEALKTVECRLENSRVMQHFLYGGYPEPLQNTSTVFFDRWMTNYHKTYIERDIRALFPQLNMPNYRRFVSMLANLSGTIVNRSEVGRSLNIGESSVRNYLDIAEDTYIWRTLPSLERTVSKSVVKMARGYLRDSGLLHHLLRIRDLDRLYINPGVGAAFEGFITEEIIQGLSTVESVPWGANFYRTRNGAEVDLVLTSPDGDRVPIEIKFGTLTKSSHLSGLKRFIEQEGLPYGIVVNNAEEVRLLTPQIIQIPAGAL